MSSLLCTTTCSTMLIHSNPCVLHDECLNLFFQKLTFLPKCCLLLKRIFTAGEQVSDSSKVIQDFFLIGKFLVKIGIKEKSWLCHDLLIHICCLIQQKYLPVLHLRYNILHNVKNRYTDLRSCNHYTQYSHKILFMFSIFIGFAK